MIKLKDMFILLLITASFSSPVLAAGGGSMGGGGSFSNPVEVKTPRELAIISYNKGLKNRDKAWSYLAKAAESSSEKKRNKLEKKAIKQYKKAEKRFRIAIKKEPLLYQAFGSLGYTLKQLGQYEEALVSYDQALSLKPEYTEAIEYRGEAHLALGRLAETKSAYIKLMNIDRPRADLLMKAIQSWLEQNHTNIKPEEQAAFKTWASERLTLSMQTLELTGADPQDWQPRQN